MDNDKTLEFDLGKNKDVILKFIVAVFLAIVAFLTFSFFAFNDTVPANLPKSSETSQLVLKEGNIASSLTNFSNPLYNFTLNYPSDLQSKITTDTLSSNKVTTISFGEYSGKSAPETDPPFVSHYSIVITQKVPATTSIETFAKLDGNNPQWSDITVAGVVGKEANYNCGSKKCNAIYVKKDTAMYIFSASETQYATQLKAALKTFKFTN